MRFSEQLKGGDLRSLGKAKEISESIQDQAGFNDLFKCLFDADCVVAMRSIDAVEKITRAHPHYLRLHKTELLPLLHQYLPKEFKWHLPLLLVRLDLSDSETGEVWATLTNWALDKNESRIVRVNSLQALHDFVMLNPDLQRDYKQTIDGLQLENIPSINARVRKLKSAGYHKD